MSNLKTDKILSAKSGADHGHLQTSKLTHQFTHSPPHTLTHSHTPTPTPNADCFRAGVGKTDITTSEKGVKIKDPLYAKALVLDDGKTKVVIIAMDVTAIGGRKISQGIALQAHFYGRLLKWIYALRRSRICRPILAFAETVTICNGFTSLVF